jgi:uncharacterized repeat protein (TIGR03803 family)
MKKSLFILAIAFCLQANAQYTNLYNFAAATPGCSPDGDLYYDGTYLYGLTPYGGTHSYGTIFKIKPDGTGYDTLRNFKGTPNGDGATATGSLISDGTFLYGTTNMGGTHSYGTIFKIMPNGTGYTVLYSFAGGTADGNGPVGKLYYDGTSLYGLTQLGGSGAGGGGTLYKIMPNGTGYTLLFSFLSTGTDGTSPMGSLISDGTYLYGTTQAGGAAANADGAVFKIMPNGTGYTNVYSFQTNFPSGNQPYGSLYYDGTYLYGMTENGGTGGGASGIGIIFKIKPDGTGYTVLHNFAGNPSDGTNPYGSLISDGTYLYGMAEMGGKNYGGMLFKIKPDGTSYDTLMSFNNTATGQNPMGSLLLNGTCLYGMTSGGGANSSGTVFSYCLAGTGIEQFANSNEQISIYPNPSNGSISIANSSNIDELKVSDVLGQVVYETKPHTTNTTLILDKAGVYFITLTSGTSISTKKVIVE